MTYLYRSGETDPYRRGQEFGAAHARQIGASVNGYRALFDTLAGAPYDTGTDGLAALAATEDFAPHLAAEIRGMAEGAGIAVADIAAINARTEILARIGKQTRGECSAVIVLPEGRAAPIAVQTWDWFHRFADNWLVWEIPHSDGSTTKTMTEYGIVGKAGLNSRGAGLLFTILHHGADGARIGVPVHVAARAALDLGGDINDAARLLATADVSASNSINLVGFEAGTATALSVEMHPGGPSFVLPDMDGTLVHTNHFIAEDPARHDIEPRAFPDTLIRRNLLQRRIKSASVNSAEQVIAAMADHHGSTAAVCCHHDPASDTATQYETLVTLSIDLAVNRLAVHAGGPCTYAAEGTGQPCPDGPAARA